MKLIPVKKPGIFFTKLDPSLHQQIMELEAKIFTSQIDLNIAMGMTPEYRKQLGSLKQERGIGLSYDHSFCAVDQENGKVVAAGYNAVFDANHAELPKIPITKESKPHEKLARFHHDLDIKWVEYFNRTGLEPNPAEFISFLVGFTTDEYAGQGIFGSFFQLCLESLSEMGFEHGFALVTSDAMKHLTVKKFGFEIIETIYLRDIELDGIRVCEDYLSKNPDKIDSYVTLAYKKF